MTRTNTFFASIATTVLLVGAPAFADGQLNASAGLTDEQAASMSLTEIAQAKFNADGRRDDVQPVSIAPASGGSDRGQLSAGTSVTQGGARGMSLTEISAVKFNDDGGRDDAQTVRSTVTAATRGSGARTSRAQLIAGAGISPADAAGLTLSEIAAAKFASDLSQSDR